MDYPIILIACIIAGLAALVCVVLVIREHRINRKAAKLLAQLEELRAIHQKAKSENNNP